MQVAVIIPTRNGGVTFSRVLAGLKDQSLAPQTLLVIDSGSVDDTVPQALAHGARVQRIPVGEFNHGATRELGRHLIQADYYLFLTQDAVPANACLVENLVRPLASNPKIGLAYSRQLPWPDAHPLEVFNRQFNYPATSKLKSPADRAQLGLKTVFCSNACAAYRPAALEAAGGFPPVIMCEDQYVAGKMLEAGYSIYYAAEALVYHSHNYSLAAEFKRYFDTGVFFGTRGRWLVDHFGAAEREGFQLFQASRRYLISTRRAHLLPHLTLRLLSKFVGYQLGIREHLLPRSLKTRLSLHRNFWIKSGSPHP
jgi:rhamnosyltransferase